MSPPALPENDPRLANPIWHALTGSQAVFAQRFGAVVRFPREIAPFLAVGSDAPVDDDLCAAVAPGEAVDFVGCAPPFGPDWQCEDREEVAQMHLDEEPAIPAGAPFRTLGDGDADAMLALTRLVYPGYFRERTRELGPYLGVFEGEQLVAMAGERMEIGPWREISAVCTHPQHLSRGHARRLVAACAARIRARGQRAFLHVSLRNTRAIAVYESLGFRIRLILPLWLVRRSLPG